MPKGIKKMLNRGKFITLEGTDGAGKSTQLENISNYFKEKNIPFILTREPGGTEIGEKIREILLDKSNMEMTPITEMYLYAASRAQNIREVILPTLKDGKFVICDRFLDSSIAYQGFGRELGNMVLEVNKYAVMNTMPDLTIFLDLSVEDGLKRVSKGEEDRLELEDINFHHRVYKGYDSLAKTDNERIVRLDARKSIVEIKNEIYKVLDKICNQ